VSWQQNLEQKMDSEKTKTIENLNLLIEKLIAEKAELKAEVDNLNDYIFSMNDCHS